MNMLKNNLTPIPTKQLYLYRILPGLLLLLISFTIANIAGKYATAQASNPVNDLFLDWLPIYNVNMIHISFAITFWSVFAIWLLKYPAFAPFVCKSASLFILIRSGFICLTHLGIPPSQLAIPGHFSALLLFSGDMFFSGHVGGPFLLYLIFYPIKRCRWLFLSMTILFGLSVLLGHIHYSIDVFSAPFITFTIFHIAKKLFKSDWYLFRMAIKQHLKQTTYPH